ncbi:hypothetical protein KA012_00005, partial [Candidatus Woesebacteria bacterium]|nr:hypothetical protein [Candidatus Woesebacteria bacterium]
MSDRLTSPPALSKARQFAAKHWLVLSLGTILITAVVGIVAQLLTSTPPPPEPTPLQGNPDNTQTAFYGITFTGNAPVVPEKMWVARVLRFDETNSGALLDSLIKNFDLQQSPYVSSVWSGDNYSLEYDSPTNEYRLSKNFDLEAEQTDIIKPTSVAQLVGIAEGEVKKIVPSVDYVSFPTKAQLLRGVTELEPATLEDATYLAIPFGLSYYNTPVLLGFARTFPMTAYVDAAGVVVRIVAQPFSAEFEASSQHTTLSTQEAIQQIQLGTGSIIDSYSPNTVTPLLEKIVRGKFTSATLEYRIDPATNLLIPYYHFVGTLANNENDVFTAE